MAEESERRESREPRVIAKPPVHVGRRTVLGILGLTGIGIAAGAKIDSALGSSITAVSSAIGVPLPGADNFRYYTITGSYPVIAADTYELAVDGMVKTPLRLSIADLRSMQRAKLVHRFQCVTGWYVPGVHWEGVLVSELLNLAGVTSKATALRFYSADGAYTESLTLAQAHLHDVIVADLMQSANLTSEHGGPVRLYVAPMYGYKSCKWLDTIELTNSVQAGYWEGRGYDVDGWVGHSNHRSDDTTS